jgi:histidinol dehydrogenase
MAIIQLEENDFIRRAKSKGMGDDALLSISSSFDHFLARNDEAELARKHLDAVQHAAPPGYKASVGFSNSLKANVHSRLQTTSP